MSNYFNTQENTNYLREKLIGLGGRSIKETHYSKLQKKISELKDSNRILSTISQIHKILVHAESELNLLDSVCKILVQAGNYKMVFIRYLTDNIFKIKAYCNIPENSLADLSLTEDKNSGNGEFLYCQNPDDLKDKKHAVLMEKNGCNSFVSFPLFYKKQLIGALNIYSENKNGFSGKDIELLTELAQDISYAITSSRIKELGEEASAHANKAEEKLHNVLLETIEAIGKAMEKRDPYTAGHQNRTSELSVAIAQHMKLLQADIETLRLAALIHDVGKLYIPGEILSRPGKLSETEFEIVKTHSQAGFDIIKNIEFGQPIPVIVWSHHERLNGSGYPRKLKDKEINLLTRILSVADVVEAMSSHRPYRPALAAADVLTELKKNTGTLYDQDVTEACIALFENHSWHFAN